MKRVIFFTFTTLALAAATFSIRAEDTNMVPATAASATAPAMASEAGSSSAESLKPEMNEDEWQFGLIVPLWAPKIDGNATVLGHQQNVSVSFNTLRQHLDAVFSAGVEARKGKYDFFGDVGYMKFSVSKSFPDGHVNSWAGLKFLYSNAGMGYTLIKTESEHPFMLEGTAGVRYWYASVPVTFSDDLGNTLFAGSKTWNLVDPVLGLRASQYFTPKLHLDISGDGGGFNISHNTDWTWSVSGLLAYDFCKYFTLSAGYQALALDESENGANGKTGLNLIFNGALVELNFHW